MKIWITSVYLMLLTLSAKAQVNTTFLENLMRQKPEVFGEILNNPNEYRVQLFYTQIDRDKNNVPHFKEFSYRLNPSEYFYPASTVKMPLAILALDKLNTLNIPGVNKSTMMYYDSVGARQEIIYNNPYCINGKQTIEQAIKEIFLVSDNNAANRLFEFIGQESVHSKLAEKGYNDAYIRNRIELGRTQDESRQTQAIDFFDDNGNHIQWTKLFLKH
jgi:beta-lactamase class A